MKNLIKITFSIPWVKCEISKSVSKIKSNMEKQTNKCANLTLKVWKQEVLIPPIF